MPGESLPAVARASNAGRSTSWPQKIPASADSISFSDLAKLACPVKTVAGVVALTSTGRGRPRSRSTVKYWLRGKHQPPADAVFAVLGEIIRRLR